VNKRPCPRPRPRPRAPLASSMLRALPLLRAAARPALRASLRASTLRSAPCPRFAFAPSASMATDSRGPGSASPAPARAPLKSADGPLVWIDCEMTGLDPATDRILEIAVRPRSLLA
jgi:DNA polymerase III epsilon subunit-like protein